MWHLLIFFLDSNASVTKSNYKPLKLKAVNLGLHQSEVAKAENQSNIKLDGNDEATQVILPEQCCTTEQSNNILQETQCSTTLSSTKVLASDELGKSAIVDDGQIGKEYQKASPISNSDNVNKNVRAVAFHDSDMDAESDEICSSPLFGNRTKRENSPHVTLSVYDADSSTDDESVNTQMDLFADLGTEKNDAPVNTDGNVDVTDKLDTNENVSESATDTNGQETGDFQCSRCFREFFDYIRYTNHIQECQGSKRRYRCIQPGCQKEYSQRSVMLQHHKSVHQAKPFLCTEDNCHHKYSSQKALKAHIKEHHKNVFKYRCQVCHQRFLNKTQYSIHLTRHTNIKPFGCMNCKNASYSTAAQLSQHVTMCLSGSQFRCQICGKNFATQTTLRQHVQNVHQAKGEFKCDLYLRIYRQYASLYKHQRTKHGKILFHLNFILKWANHNKCFCLLQYMFLFTGK